MKEDKQLAMTKFTPTNARELAFYALDKVRGSQAYSNLQVDSLLKKHPLNAADRRLMTTIVYGTLQHQLTLQYWLGQVTGNRQLDPWVETLLLTAMYQFHYLERVPDWAVTDETIKIAKRRGNPGVRKFVTGVLHAALRAGWPDFTAIQPTAKRLSIQASVPEWLVTELMKEYGHDQTSAILTAINQPAHVSIRVNTSTTTVDHVQAQLNQQGITTHPSPISPECLVVDSGDVIDSPLFRDGQITIQDESAALAVDSMDVQAGDNVLDACAAPGGKTVQIAARLSASAGGEVTALDIHQHKIRLIEQNAQRMGVSDRVHAQALDARQVDQQFADQSFDKILVDAPCSGIGLLRRKPEIRYTKSLVDSQRLHKIQLAILDAVAPKVKKGGIITYSTCTILREENDHTVDQFLQGHPDFELVKTSTTRAVKDDRHSATLTILPSDYGSDGFFISSLQRKL